MILCTVPGHTPLASPLLLQSGRGAEVGPAARGAGGGFSRRAGARSGMQSSSSGGGRARGRSGSASRSSSWSSLSGAPVERLKKWRVGFPRTQALPQHSASDRWQKENEKERQCLLPHRLRTSSKEGGVFEHGGQVVGSLTRVDEATAPSWGPSSSLDGVYRLPPKPLLVAAPREDGEYPVLMFLPGYQLANSSYSQMLQHIASHAYIVVAPQLYKWSGPDTTKEINAAVAVINWLPRGLSSVLPPGVRADLSKGVSVSGHSRGGKVAFAVAFGHAESKLALPIAALVAVDPVDGMAVGNHTQPAMVTGKKHSLHVPCPAMVIGTGLGELPRFPWLPPCAPRGLSHEAFYDELDASEGACYFVARDYGHMDMMNDDMMGCLTGMLCSSGEAIAHMQLFTGGATVAFLNKEVKGDGAGLDGLRAHPEQAPVALSVVKFSDDLHQNALNSGLMDLTTRL